METIDCDRQYRKRDSREAPPEPSDSAVPYSGDPFGVVTFRLMARDDLELSDKALLIVLQQWAWLSGECYPSVATIARAADLCERTVKRSLKRLDELGFIKIRPADTNPTGRVIECVWMTNPDLHPQKVIQPSTIPIPLGGLKVTPPGGHEVHSLRGTSSPAPLGGHRVLGRIVSLEESKEESSDARDSLADSLGSRSVAMSPQGSPPVPLSPAAAETTGEAEKISTCSPEDGGQRQRQRPERDPDGPPPRGGPPPAPGGKPARPAPRSGLSEGRRIGVSSYFGHDRAQGSAGASGGPPPAPADDDPTELARGDAPPQEQEDPNALMTAFIRAELARGAPALESVTTPPTLESVTTPGPDDGFLACLTPTERSAYESATPGKQKNLVNLLRLGMEDVVRSELATIAVSMKRPHIEPETASLTALLAYLRSTDDPAVLTTTAARLAAETGDGPQSWPHWERVAADVRSGTLRPDDILRPLAYATDPASKVGKPAAYVARSIKAKRHQLQTAGALA